MEAPTTIVLDGSSEEEQPIRRPGRAGTRAATARKRRASPQHKQEDKKDKENKPDNQATVADVEDPQGSCCTICLELISKEGAHAPATLPCGHIFGKACIDKWLSGAGRGKGCPQCKKKATLKNVITLYNLPTVVAGDATYTQDLESKCAQKEKETKEQQKEIEKLRAQLAEEARAKEELMQRSARMAALAAAETAKAVQQQQQQQQQQQVQGTWTGQQQGPNHYILAPPTQQAGMLQHQQTGPPPRPEAQSTWQSHACQGAGSTGHTQPPFQGGAGHCASTWQHKSGRHIHAGPIIQSSKLHSFTLSNSSCFDWVPSEGLILASSHEGGLPSLRVLSMANPTAYRCVSLPSDVQQTRDLKIRSRDKMVAVATQGAGLLVLDRRVPQPVRRLADDSTVWTCSWGPQDDSCYQLFAGLDKGRVLLFDLRSTSTEPQHMWQLPNFAPVHTVMPLPTPQATTNTTHILAASSTGVWAMGATASIGMQAAVSVLDKPVGPGYTCGSLAKDATASHFMVSWRSLQPGCPAKHQQLQLATGQHWPPCMQAQPLEYYGHWQQLHRTRGTYLEWRSQSLQMFASADEATCAPWIWSCATGQVIHRLDAHPGPVVQLASGQAPDGETLLAACSHSLLEVHNMQLRS